MRDSTEDERYVGTDPDEIIRLRLERLRSIEICKKLLQQKMERFGLVLTPETIEKKAVGLSSVIDSALSYLSSDSKDLNSRILTRYYAVLQLSIAEEVASVHNDKGLPEVQKHTESGHGLATVNNFATESQSIDNIYCFVLQSGHFSQYLKFKKIQNLSFFTQPKRIKAADITSCLGQIVSVRDLFRSIPELYEIIEEYVNAPPLTLWVSHASKNMSLDSERQREQMFKTGKLDWESGATSENGSKTTYIRIITSSKTMTLDYLRSLNTPFTDFEYSDGLDDGYPICKFNHPGSGHWGEHLPLYKSAYCGTTYINPLWNAINDPSLINFMLLYSLSIMTRYLPDFWYLVTKGDLSHIGNLIDYYLSTIDHTFPKLMLERIMEKSVHVAMPGGWDAPI